MVNTIDDTIENILEPALEEKYHFSPSEKGFYPESLQDLYEAAGTWPSDLVLLSSAEYDEFAGQAAPKGKELGTKSNKPAWVKYIPTLEERKVAETMWKDSELARARDELELVQDGRGVGTEKDWRNYRNALRDYTEAKNFPKNKRPAAPDNNEIQEK